MFLALNKLGTKCFKISGAAAGDPGGKGINALHNWVVISLWKHDFKTDEQTNKIDRPPDECQIRLDAWAEYRPKFYTPETHGFEEIAWTHSPGGSLVLTYAILNGKLGSGSAEYPPDYEDVISSVLRVIEP